MKPIQVKKFHIGYAGKRLSHNASRRNIIAEMNPQCATGVEGYDHVPHRNSLNILHSEQHIFENIIFDSDKGVKLPPVTQMAPHNGKINLVHKIS